MSQRRLPLTVRTIVIACLAVATAGHVRAQSPLPEDSSFSLEPGDVVQTSVWQEKDLTGKFQVDEAGRLTLPMLGVINVRGRPWERLRDSLINEYQSQLRNPSVTLTPLRRVQVLGEVMKPGQILADPTVSIAGAVALAGGANPNGDLHRVRVVRNGRTIVKPTSVESLLAPGGIHSNDQIFVDARPWIERNAGLVASSLLSVTGILVTIIRR
jgi:polysaccharide export outer membrane protein